MDELFKAAVTADDSGKWLLDARLENTWKRLDSWLAGIPERQRADAATVVVGALTLPVWLIPAPGAAGMESSPGKKMRETRSAADDDLKKAAIKLREAADLIAEARGRTSILPDVALTAFSLFAREIPVRYRRNVPSYFHTSPDTVRMLRAMADRLEKEADWPPGLEGPKTSWRDWLREAFAAIREVSEVHGKVPLRETDWVWIANAAPGLQVSRESVQAALKRNGFYDE